jgi:hypothetical protein
VDISSNEQNDDEDAHDALEKGRGRPRGSLNAQKITIATIDISSEAGNDDDDNLLIDHDAGGNSSDGPISDGVIKRRVSAKDRNVQNAGLPSDSEEEVQVVRKPPPKRRGRPPKQASALVSAISPPAPAGMTKLLSLNEKHALRGKVFKIPTKKHSKPIELSAVTPAVSTTRSTPSIIIPRSVANNTPLLSPEGEAGWSSVKNSATIIRNDRSVPTQVVKLSNGDSSMSSRAIEQPVKSPTVVPLESPSDESYDSERSVSPSDDNDNDSISAVRPSPPKSSHGGGS